MLVASGLLFCCFACRCICLIGWFIFSIFFKRSTWDNKPLGISSCSGFGSTYFWQRNINEVTAYFSLSFFCCFFFSFQFNFFDLYLLFDVEMFHPFTLVSEFWSQYWGDTILLFSGMCRYLGASWWGGTLLVFSCICFQSWKRKKRSEKDYYKTRTYIVSSSYFLDFWFGGLFFSF